MKLATCCASLVAIALPAAAQSFTGNDLLRLSEQPADGRAAYFVVGLVQGVYLARTMMMLGSSDEEVRAVSAASMRARICPPDGTTREKMLDATVAWLRANPAQLDNDAAGLTYIALRQSWPCR